MQGWTINVRCPHGKLHEMPLDWIYRMQLLPDMCPEGKKERMETAPPPGRYRLWRESRKARKELRGL